MKTNYKLAIALVAGAAIGGAAIQGLHAQAKPPVYVVGEISVTNGYAVSGDVPIAVELRRADVPGMNVTRPS